MTGKCDYCDSTDGQWMGSKKALWNCNKCGGVTSYFRITELGKAVLEELLPSVDSDKESTQFNCGACGDKWNLISPQGDTDTCPRCGMTVYSDKQRTQE